MTWIFYTNCDSCSVGGHAYVLSVGVTMVVEGFPRLREVDDRDDVHHKKITSLLAMSVHQKCAMVDHVYVQLVEF